MAFLKFICQCANIIYLVKQHNAMIMLLSLKFSYASVPILIQNNVITSICFNKRVSCLSIISTVKFVIYCTTHYYWSWDYSGTLVTLSWMTRTPREVELSPISLDITLFVMQSFLFAR